MVRLARCVLAAALALAAATPVPARDFALLVGIRDYIGEDNDLFGAVNDVESIRDLLVEREMFRPEEIQVLRDKEASKRGILRAMDRIVRKARKGSRVLLYFSGHGTSLSANRRLQLPWASGAFMPHDQKIRQVANWRNYTAGLVTGRLDLRPRLLKLDRRGVKVLFAIDACYSEFTSRWMTPRGEGVAWKAKLYRLPPALKGLEPEPEEAMGARHRKPAPYPFRNVVTLASSRTSERSLDLRGGTVDGKPHGAFTDAMLRTLGNPRADLDGDGKISTQEIYQRVKELLAARPEVNHSPKLFPEAARTEPWAQELRESEFFGGTRSAPSPPRVTPAPLPAPTRAAPPPAPTQVAPAPTRVAPAPSAPPSSVGACDSAGARLGVSHDGSVPPELLAALRKEPGLQVGAEGGAHLARATRSPVVEVRDAAGQLIRTAPAQDAKAVASALRFLGLRERALCRAAATNTVPFEVDLVGPEDAVVPVGERFRIRVAGLAGWHLGVAFLSPSGEGTWLYPDDRYEAEFAPLASGDVRVPAEPAKPFEAQAPAESDMVVVLASHGEANPFRSMIHPRQLTLPAMEGLLKLFASQPGRLGMQVFSVQVVEGSGR
jgi:hypothetical protein